MIRVYLFLIFLIHSKIGISQTDYKIKSDLIIKDYYYLSVLNSQQVGDSTFIFCKAKIDDNKSIFPVVFIVKNNKVVSIKRLILTSQVFFSDIKIVGNYFILLGETPTYNDEEMQDYVGLFDLNGNQLWDVKLEKKFEGLNKIFPSKDYFEVFTSGLRGLYIYKINYQGKILKSQSVKENNYIHDVIKLENSQFLIMSESLNSKGKGNGLNLTLCDFSYKILNSKSFESTERFLPEKILEYDHGFIIAGNIESDRSIPCIYFIDKNMSLKKISRFHYEPDYYKFKTNFRINDILYSKTGNIFYSCGTVGSLSDVTNIAFILNEDKLLSFKLLDKTGLWGNNIIVKNKSNKYMITDVKNTSDFDTSIKLMELDW